MDEKEFQRIAKKTQDTLGKVIKKPPLTDKLLKKPPFRFLHDIMTSVLKTTGFMKGLFTSTEMNSENVKEKDAKVAFLQKAIDIVVLVNGKSLSVKPTKIVSGHEPEKTNEFLQALAAAINKKVSNDEYVQKVLSGDKSSKPAKKEKEVKDEPKPEKKAERKEEKKEDKDKKKDRESSRPREDRDKKEKSKDKEDKKEPNPSEDKEDHRNRTREGSSRDRRDGRKDRSRDGRDKENRERSKDRDKDADKDDRRRHRREKEKEPDKEDEKVNGDETPAVAIAMDEGSDTHPAKIPRPSSAKGSRRRARNGRGDTSADEDEDEKFRTTVQPNIVTEGDTDNNNETIGEDDLPPQVAAARRMGRPPSARPAPPKLKKQNEALTQDPDVRISSGKRVTNVIIDDTPSDDDDDNFVVQDAAPGIVSEPEPILMNRDAADDEDAGEHGGLVKKILETKKELEGGNQAGNRKTEIEKPIVSDAARRKEREMVQKEIDMLRGSIQTLTRSANPLGKIMDYVQEDLDSMQKELQKWKSENKEHLLALKREQSVTDSSVEPLKAHLKELDQTIADQFDQIAAVKSKIIHNDEKIDKMLGSITKS